VLGPGETLMIEFVSDLMRAFQGKLDTQVPPGNVLVHSFQRIFWWVPPAIRAMFYVADRSPELDQLSGKRYPQPALLFDVSGTGLRIRALENCARPNADTPPCALLERERYRLGLSRRHTHARFWRSRFSEAVGRQRSLKAHSPTRTGRSA
jgi:Prokaryotic E2 family D